MLKPYSFRKEFLLTLIAGSTCATTMHYVLIQPEHFEESVNVFALIGLLAMCGKWPVFPAWAAQKEGNKLLSVSVAVVWVCLISVAEIFTSGAYSNISEISPWSGVIGVALVSPFMVKILAMSDDTFRESMVMYRSIMNPNLMPVWFLHRCSLFWELYWSRMGR